MEQRGATDVVVRNRNYNIKPAQVVDAHVDEEIEFPEFAFPVSDGASTLDAWKAVSTAGQAVQSSNDNCNWGFLQLGGGLGDESPKRMPLAFRSKYADTALESNTCFPSLVTDPAPKQCLSPLATFKNLDLTHENGKVEIIEKSSSDLTAVPSTPTRKGSSINPKVTKDLAAVRSTPARKGSSVNSKVAKSQVDTAKTPDRVRPGTLSASAVSGKTSSGMRGSLTSHRGSEERVGALSPTSDRKPLSPPPDRRALSPTLDRRSLTSPRRLVSERSRSPVPFLKQDRGNSGVSRSLSPVLTSPRSITPTRRSSTPRSTSPAPTSRMDPNPNPPREQWSGSSGSSVRSASMPTSPRYITPTRAASLKAVSSSSTSTGSVSKELHYPTVPGSATPQRDTVKRGLKDAHAKGADEAQSALKVRTSPSLTQPAGFNFKTDERSEKRRDFYSKLEEKTKLKEEEKKRLEVKAQEEKESQLRELRKTLTYKANPVPKFYQEPPPPPVQFKKSPPTRARSPNFTAPRRRESCSGSIGESSSSGSSPLRGRFVRSPSLESNVSSHAKVSHKEQSAGEGEDRERENC